jgi:hypothetical protein
MFKSCEICGADNWDLVVYEGAVRSGSLGTRTEGGRIIRCGGCGADRLDEKVSITSVSYDNDEYRIAMDQGGEIANFFNQADQTKIYNLSSFWPLNLRDKVIANIGCEVGSFISHVFGLVENNFAIEPTEWYHSSLRQCG